MELGSRAASSSPARWISAAFAAVALCAGFPTMAQVPPAAWTNKCHGCHQPTPGAGRANAANAAGIITYVIAHSPGNGTNMQGITFVGTELTDITDYLESVFDTSPMATSASFQGSSGAVSLAGKVVMNTGPTGLNVLETVSPPQKGTISYNTATPSFTYTAGACKTGNDSFTYRARNTSSGGPSTSTRTVNVTIGNPTAPPTITSGSTATASTGTLFTYSATVSASACPSLVSWTLSGAPTWLTINSSGVVSGTPPNGTAGTSPTFTVNARYPSPPGASSSKTVTVTISQGGPTTPAITSPPTASGTVGMPFTYQITANNSPTSFGATGLPDGLSVNPTTGLISGVPTIQGTFPATVNAMGAAPPPASGVVAITIGSGAAGLPVAQDKTTEASPGAPTPITLPISGQFTQVMIVDAPAHGTAATPSPGSAVVIYTSDGSYTGPDSFTYNAVGPGGASNTARVNITVISRPPVAHAATLPVPLNAPTPLDLGPFITGSGITGVAVATEASHGTTAVNGTKVTYTPAQDYFGPDSFSYIAFGDSGTSSPAVVTVTVTGRPDPSKDPNVSGLINAQSQVARRFARAQISNYQRRMETLHVDPPNSDAAAASPPAKKAAERPTSGPDVVVRDAPPYAVGFARTSPDSANPGTNTTGFLPASFVSSMISMAQSGTVNLANSTERSDASAGPASGFGLWTGGNVSFGTRDTTERSAGSHFTTDGITVGGDWRASSELVLGMGVGWAQDKTHFGDDGTKMKSDGTSVAAYASYQPSRSTFIDALVGYGTLNFDSDRHIASVDQFAFANRDGHQIFGSVAAGFEYRSDGLLLSPYGRLDYTYDKFKQVTETGAGLNALAYLDQTQHTFQGSLGLRAESQHETSFGLVRPRARIEYRHDFEGGGDATITYADQFAGLSYSVAPVGTKKNFLVLGAGGDFLIRGGLRLGIDYQWQSSGGADSGQAIRLLVSQELDGKGWPSPPWTSRTLADAVRVEAGFTYDDNVTRGRDSDEILSDKIYSLNASTSRTVPLSGNTRAVVTGLLNGEMFHTYTGLAHLSGGLQAEMQYRGSADYDAVTLAAFARGFLDGYNSHLRDGGRWSVGASARSSLTDRIDVYGEVSSNWRRAQSDVWNLTDYVARMNIDYSLGRNGTFYLAGEFHRGDTVADGKASLVNLSLADVFVRDDAFPGKDLFAYRFDAKTLVGTLGYNLPLGPRDSIDFSWRHVQTTPTARPSFDTSGSLRYFDNQYTVLYLLRF